MTKFLNLILLSLLSFALISANALADSAVNNDTDGDGLSDIALYSPADNKAYFRRSSNGMVNSAQLGAVGNVPLLRDFDGDAFADYGTYNPGTGQWNIFLSGAAQLRTFTFGGLGHIVLAGDFNGNGSSSAVAYNRNTGQWRVDTTLNGQANLTFTVAAAGNVVPLVGDVNGDGLEDAVIFNRSTNLWTVRYTGGSTVTFTFGQKGDIPFLADANGNGADNAWVYRQSEGAFYRATSFSNGGVAQTQKKAFGLPGLDLPFAACDVNGNGSMDLCVKRLVGSSVYIDVDGADSAVDFTLPFASMLPSSAGVPNASTPPRTALLPLTSQTYAPQTRRVRADFDGDGRSDVSFVRTNTLTGVTTWTAVSPDGNVSRFEIPPPIGAWVPPANAASALLHGDMNGDGKAQPVVITVLTLVPGAPLYWAWWDRTGVKSDFWGVNGDTPILGDFDCDGKKDIAIVRPGNDGLMQWWAKLSSGGYITDAKFGLTQGIIGHEGGHPTSAHDRPFAFDVTGDGCDEFVVLRELTNHPQNLLYWYYAKPSSLGDATRVQWGLKGDSVTSGDFDGDGRIQPAVHRNIAGGIYQFTRSVDSGDTGNMVQWGLASGDIYLNGDFSGANFTEHAVYRSSNAAGSPGSLVYRRFNETAGQLIAGLPGDKLVRPDNTTVEIAGPSAPPVEGGAGCTATPGTPNTFVDGGLGHLWKHHTEGVPNGAPAAIFKSSWGTVNVTFLGKNGNQVTSVQKQKFANPDSDGRNRYHVWSQKTCSQLRPDAPITVRAQFGSQVACMVVSDPCVRYD